MVDAVCSDATVFYTFDANMMKHKDENCHDENGKMTPLEELSKIPSFRSPEIPFRIKSIYEYLRTTPANTPLLSQMHHLSIAPMDIAEWTNILL